MKDMGRNTKTLIVSMVATLAALVGLAFLTEWLDGRRAMKVTGLDTVMAETLRGCMDGNDSLICGMVSVKETGSARYPRTLLLVQPDLDAEIWSDEYVFKATVLPEALMQTATLAFFMDRRYINPDDMVPTPDGDSISVREGFLQSSREVADWMATGDDRRLYDARSFFMDSFDDYFGSSESCYIPDGRYHMREVAASIADGYGLLLSQEQILTFFDSIAGGGVRARHRYFRKRRICREETARQMVSLLRENVTEGTAASLAGHPLQIAGKTGVGMLEFGNVPGKGRVSEKDSVVVASFAGFFPADSPKFTMCVTLYSDTPGCPPDDVAMDVFGKIATRLYEDKEVWKR